MFHTFPPMGVGFSRKTKGILLVLALMLSALVVPFMASPAQAAGCSNVSATQPYSVGKTIYSTAKTTCVAGKTLAVKMVWGAGINTTMASGSTTASNSTTVTKACTWNGLANRNIRTEATFNGASNITGWANFTNAYSATCKL